MTERFDVIGCKINALTREAAIQQIIGRVQEGAGGYVCFVNVHVAVTSQKNHRLRAAVNESLFSFPDGRPLYWIGRRRFQQEVEQISGPDFMPSLLSKGCGRSPALRHYFYGGRPDVLELVISRAREQFPGVVIAGAESPPYRALTSDEVEASISRISDARPDIIWVGLGAPKQELWMSTHWQRLAPAILMGVGAAFDFHAGNVQRAPRWMSNLGLEWMHRLMQEPRRLFWRYASTNSRFLYHLAKSRFRRRMSS